MTDSNETFDPMKSFDPTPDNGRDFRHTIFDVIVGVFAGFLAKWIMESSNLGILVAPIVTVLVSKTTLYEVFLNVSGGIMKKAKERQEAGQESAAEGQEVQGDQEEKKESSE